MPTSQRIEPGPHSEAWIPPQGSTKGLHECKLQVPGILRPAVARPAHGPSSLPGFLGFAPACPPDRSTMAEPHLGVPALCRYDSSVSSRFPLERERPRSPDLSRIPPESGTAPDGLRARRRVHRGSRPGSNGAPPAPTAGAPPPCAPCAPVARSPANPATCARIRAMETRRNPWRHSRMRRFVIPRGSVWGSSLPRRDSRRRNSQRPRLLRRPSPVERHLAKVDVDGSNPFTRSILYPG